MPDTLYSLAGKRIWVAGHRGMVGAALFRRLEAENPAEIITATREDLDLGRQADVEAWVAKTKPDAIFLAAAKVGGILANDTYPAEFLYENLAIAQNVIHAAYLAKTEKLIFLGSSCIYPKLADQPITEDALLTGPLEPTNEWYAIAKIAGIKLCQAYRKQYGCDFISAMPTNLYGPGDNFHAKNSHVIPALIRRAIDTKVAGEDNLSIWGTGKARREFMHVDDCADGLVHLMKSYSGADHINVSTGNDITIEKLAKGIMRAVGLTGELEKDVSKPDGTPQKLMDNSKLTEMGWAPKINLNEGLSATVKWYLSQDKNNLRC